MIMRLINKLNQLNIGSHNLILYNMYLINKTHNDYKLVPLTIKYLWGYRHRRCQSAMP